MRTLLAILLNTIGCALFIGVPVSLVYILPYLLEF